MRVFLSLSVMRCKRQITQFFSFVRRCCWRVRNFELCATVDVDVDERAVSFWRSKKWAKTSDFLPLIHPYICGLFLVAIFMCSQNRRTYFVYIYIYYIIYVCICKETDAEKRERHFTWDWDCVRICWGNKCEKKCPGVRVCVCDPSLAASAQSKEGLLWSSSHIGFGSF